MIRLNFAKKINGGEKIGKKLSLKTIAGFLQKLLIWDMLGDFLEKFHLKNSL
jgi:hypothetical protein